jgi:hypothetical protein
MANSNNNVNSLLVEMICSFSLNKKAILLYLHSHCNELLSLLK